MVLNQHGTGFPPIFLNCLERKFIFDAKSLSKRESTTLQLQPCHNCVATDAMNQDVSFRFMYLIPV